MLEWNVHGWVVDESGDVHTSTDTILAAQFDINAICAHVVLKIVCGICEKEDDWREDDEGEYNNWNGGRLQWWCKGRSNYRSVASIEYTMDGESL